MRTLSDLIAELQLHDAAYPLVFETREGNVSPGYHVTELRHSWSKGVDCAGHVEAWQEARLQLLDGRGTTHMSVGKFRDILAKGMWALPELEDAALLIEFGHDNKGLTLLTVGAPELRGDRVVLSLEAARPVCKPMNRLWRSKDHPDQSLSGETPSEPFAPGETPADASAAPHSCCA